MSDQADIRKTMQSWADLQKSIWDRWLENLEQGKDTTPEALWKNGLEHWKESVEKTLDYQVESLRAWAGGLEDNENTPAEIWGWAREGVAMVESWVDAERKLWDQWFELMGSARGTAGNPMQVTGEQWQQFGEKMLEMQSNLTSAWLQSFPARGRGKK